MSEHPAGTRPSRPWATWAFMVLGLIWAVYPVMTGALVSHGMLYLSVPVVLGLAGAILAVVQRRLGWAMVAGVWGVLPDVV
ncbi:hypothetical protein [Micrococcus luteus]|uniref:hypothetical protein n=1 Tax=Micrococcus luteus TaxID=1270 RepID=UPI0020CC466C|nr:hypothetical protein [Micrococcus luteus]UTT46191.1 hypothetical protein NMQ02_02880 [Micrococcus luteus]